LNLHFLPQNASLTSLSLKVEHTALGKIEQKELPSGTKQWQKMLQVLNVDMVLHVLNVDMVLQVLNVDMVDRGLCFTATNIDCSLDMELQSDTTGVQSDQVLAPPSGFKSVFSWAKKGRAEEEKEEEEEEEKEWWLPICDSFCLVTK